MLVDMLSNGMIDDNDGGESFGGSSRGDSNSNFGGGGYKGD